MGDVKIERVENGWIVTERVTSEYELGKEKEIEERAVFEIKEDWSDPENGPEMDAGRDMLLHLIDILGLDETSRYSKRRMRIVFEPGDKYEIPEGDEMECELCGSKLE